MNAQRLKLTTPSVPPTAPARGDPINTWLDTLSLVLKLPREQRESIRDELAGHLRERVRDLVLTGTPEDQAATTALSELGDAAKLAHRLRAASRGPARRIAMNLAVIGIASAALVTSFVALRGPEERPAPVVMPQAAARAPEQVEKIKLTLGPGATWSDLLKQVADKAGMPIEVRWRALEEMGYRSNEPVHAEMKDQPLPGAFRFIAEETGQPANDVDYRVIDARLVIATTAYFDQRETVLVAYDLSDQVAQRAKFGQEGPDAALVVSEVRNVIQRLVHSEGWEDNGGTLASTAVFGSKLFIKAPKRYHTEIQWVLDQLPKPEQHAGTEIRLDRTASAQIDAQRSIPVLRDVPVVNEFVTRTPIRLDAPITVRAENGGPVEVARPDGTLKADQVRIAPPTQPPAATDPSSTTPASPPRAR